MPKRLIIILIVLFLMFFVALVNFKAPVVRASLMITFYFLSKSIKRPQHPLNTTALAAVFILLIQPQQLFLAGFQYSFSAVFGLIIGSIGFNKRIPVFPNKSRLFRLLNSYLRLPFIGSFSAILATIPLTLYYFGNLQIGALFANIFVIPVIGLIVFLSIIFLLFSILSFLPSTGLALILNFIIGWLISLISLIAKLPFIQLNLGHPSFFSMLYTVLCVVFLFNFYKKAAKWGLAILVSLMIVFQAFRNFSGDNLIMTFINVGQGDATLIQFPNKKFALIDAGNKGFGFDAGQRYVDPVLKYYGISRLNYLIGSHPHGDHIGGFEYILDNYRVDTLILNEVNGTSKLFKTITSKANFSGTVIKRLEGGDILKADKNVRIYVLHPSDQFEKVNLHSGKSVNNSSLVFKMVHGQNNFLFMGDAEVEAEHTFIHYKDFLRSDILKVGHHGSRTSSSEAFIQLVHPAYAIISVGKNNKFNHPSLKTLITYSQRKIPTLRTDLIGAIIFISNGRRITRINWR